MKRIVPRSDAVAPSAATAEDEVQCFLPDVFVEDEDSQWDQCAVEEPQPNQHRLHIVGALLDFRDLPEAGVVECEVGGGADVKSPGYGSKGWCVSRRLVFIVGGGQVPVQLQVVGEPVLVYVVTLGHDDVGTEQQDVQNHQG